ncbi:MAG: hypothetical protein Q8T08_08805 [Ignavibacteria bacterium]|nr:hypothetical protein [Ignavibacteria bacterium]
MAGVWEVILISIAGRKLRGNRLFETITISERGFLWGKQFAGKNKRKSCFCGLEKVYLLRHETIARAVLKLV